MADLRECWSAIEEVRWKHRSWPEQNPGNKPDFASVVPAALVEAQVDDALRMATALQQRYETIIDGAAVQRELNRVVTGTKAPEMLAEMLAALGNDVGRIATCMIAPQLVRRQLEQRYEHDPDLHQAVRLRAEKALAGIGDLQKLISEDVRVFEYSILRDPSGEEVSSGDEISLPSAEFESIAESLRASSGHASLQVEEEPHAFVARQLLSSTEDRLRVRAASWAKVSFHAWWGRSKAKFNPAKPFVAPDKAGLRLPPLMMQHHAKSIPADTWVSEYVPLGRGRHVAVWTGSEMLVWGGLQDGDNPVNTSTGGLYDPATDSWRPTSQNNAPTARAGHTGVWTGSELIVWGGDN